MMPEITPKILLVEPDADLMEILLEAFTRRFNAEITCVPDAGGCLDVEFSDPHELIVAELRLDDVDGLELARRLMTISSRPVVLLADQPTREETLEAVRSGVRDIFPKPFPISDLLDAIQRQLDAYQLRQRHVAKYRKMRDLVRRVIRERRDLSRRMDLICRDLVSAQRQLVHRVIDLERSRTT